MRRSGVGAGQKLKDVLRVLKRRCCGFGKLVNQPVGSPIQDCEWAAIGEHACKSKGFVGAEDQDNSIGNHSSRGGTLGRPPQGVRKVVLTTKAQGEKGKKYTVGSFVMPNANIPPDVPLTRFVVPLDSLERTDRRPL